MASLAERLAARKLAEAQAAPAEEKKENAVAVTKITEAIKAAPSSALAIGSPEPKSTVDLVPRIKELADLSGEDLTDAMKELKKALMHNPDAVALMLPEDIGDMVTALRRMTGESIVAATTKKPAGKAKAKVLTAEEMAAAFEEL